MSCIGPNLNDNHGSFSVCSAQALSEGFSSTFGLCYKVIDDVNTEWSVAKADCGALGGRLIVLNPVNAATMSQLLNDAGRLHCIHIHPMEIRKYQNSGTDR